MANEDATAPNMQCSDFCPRAESKHCYLWLLEMAWECWVHPFGISHMPGAEVTKKHQGVGSGGWVELWEL